jgi:hypothetical protein
MSPRPAQVEARSMLVTARCFGPSPDPGRRAVSSSARAASSSPAARSV